MNTLIRDLVDYVDRVIHGSLCEGPGESQTCLQGLDTKTSKKTWGLRPCCKICQEARKELAMAKYALQQHVSLEQVSARLFSIYGLQYDIVLKHQLPSGQWSEETFLESTPAERRNVNVIGSP